MPDSDGFPERGGLHDQGTRHVFRPFFIDIASRSVHIAGITRHPDNRWMTQIARNVTDTHDGFFETSGTSLWVATRNTRTHSGRLLPGRARMLFVCRQDRQSERVRRKICPLNKRGMPESDVLRGARIASTRGHTIMAREIIKA
jgi:hypothetical protein